MYDNTRSYPYGFDVGIRVTHGGSWRPFMYGFNCFANDADTQDGPAFPKSAMQPGMTLSKNEMLG